jgi:uncharacterized repeat protein (TIGR02543 family)
MKKIIALISILMSSIIFINPKVVQASTNRTLVPHTNFENATFAYGTAFYQFDDYTLNIWGSTEKTISSSSNLFYDFPASMYGRDYEIVIEHIGGSYHTIGESSQTNIRINQNSMIKLNIPIPNLEVGSGYIERVKFSIEPGYSARVYLQNQGAHNVVYNDLILSIKLYSVIIEEYVISYNLNNGSEIVNLIYQEGDVISNLDNPFKTNHFFEGWYHDSSFENKVIFPFTPVSSSTIYAKWIQKPTLPSGFNIYSSKNLSSWNHFTVGSKVYISNSTSIHMDMNKIVKTRFEDVEYFTAVTSNSNYNRLVIKIENGPFMYFDIDSLGNVLAFYREGDGFGFDFTGQGIHFDLEEGQKVYMYVTGRNTVDENQVFTVYFDSNGGSQVPFKTAINGTKMTTPLNPTKIGYTFSGWYIDQNFLNAWTFSSDIVTEPMTLYAKWTEKLVETPDEEENLTRDFLKENWIVVMLFLICIVAIASKKK